MTSAPHDRPRTASRVRGVALLAAASLACSTVRSPASALRPTVTIRGDVAEPQIALWVESGEDVSPAEAARAAGAARAALEQALAARRLDEGEQLLVVRAQGVSRTGSRRLDQNAAVAGIVVGAVVILVVAVVALVATRGKGGGGAKAPEAHAAPATAGAARPAPVPGAARPAPAPPRPAPPRAPPRAPPPPPRLSGGDDHPEVGVGLDVQIVVPVVPGGPPPVVLRDSLVTGAAPAPPQRERTIAEVALPPMRPLEVSERGFFAGDVIRLELTLLDRASLVPLWVKTVESEDDPRDAGAVRALLDRALDDPHGWEPAVATP